ncbi:long-chain-fatty-acid--CoA ligase ACSBG2-like isoform X2 [Mixophyes fleayi]|uniref:long-chain-fatty-acid--CoA ligase ACSBG2-like isoform X2 n=1 Tax=Mixophyes fleayi TaxID=3061075 RepID=UPI003F4E3E9F
MGHMIVQDLSDPNQWAESLPFKSHMGLALAPGRSSEDLQLNLGNQHTGDLQLSGETGEEMSSLVEEDSTESFVEISDCEEAAQPPQQSEHQEEQSQVKRNQEQESHENHQTPNDKETLETTEEGACRTDKQSEISNQKEHPKYQETQTEREPEETLILCEDHEHPEKPACEGHQEEETDEHEEPQEAPNEIEPDKIQESQEQIQREDHETHEEPACKGHKEEEPQEALTGGEPAKLQENQEQTQREDHETHEEPTCKGHEEEEPQEALTGGEPAKLQEGEEPRDAKHKKENTQEATYGEEHAQPLENGEVSQEATNEREETQSEQETDEGINVKYAESKDSKYESPAQCNVIPPEGNQEQDDQPPTTVSDRPPEQSLWTVDGDGSVTLRMEESGPAATSPKTVPQLFSQAVTQYGQKMALYARGADGWEGVTYLQYERWSRAVARGLLKLGLERFRAVLILGFNSPKWFMTEIGAILAGGLAVGIDPLSTGSYCLKVALDSQAQIIVVQDPCQLQKILQVQEKLPKLKAIVQWTGHRKESLPGTYTWEQLINLGSEVEESYLNEVIESQRPNQCCAVMYPNAGTSELRGVMLSHDNVTWTSRAVGEMLGLGSEEVVVSYLPLSHMAVQLFDIWLPLCCGGTTYFAESAACKGSLISTLRDVRPTRFLGFPEFWKKVKNGWMMMEKVATPLQRKVMGWAREKGLLSYKRPSVTPWGYSLADHLVFRTARLALGLDRCTHCYAGISPISQNTAEYFGSLGIEVLELNVMNETSGLYGLALPVSARRGSSGLEITGSRSHWSHVQNRRTLYLWGRHVFMGYLCMVQATREVLDEDGWLMTDVLGRGDESSSLHVGERGSHTGQMMKTRVANDCALYMEI